jgi:hypothetical protein
MTPIIKITRYWQDGNQTLGTCIVLGENDLPLFSGISLERGWQDNKKGISCIPKGTGPYEVVLEWSNRFKTMLWEIKGVPGRSECKFHSANYWRQLNGCVALGRRPTDIDNDGYVDVTSSKSTMKDFHNALKKHNKALLMITGKPTIK